MLLPSFSRARARYWSLCGFSALLCIASWAQAEPQEQLASQAIIYKVDAATDRLEMIVNSSRILTLEHKIPQAQVNNPEVLEVTPLSPNQIQVFAKRAGVTQVNLWDEDETIHTVDVIVFGDARELAMILEMQFPNASLKVLPLANSVIVSGFVDNPEDVGRIIQVAEDFHPKVINNLRVGGTQQVLLHLKVMEISRTKARNMGFDFVNISSNDFFASGVSGILNSITSASGEIGTTGRQTMSFGIVDGSNSFFGFLEALREHNLMKIMAEPDLMTYSGRPAFFNVGGEFPVLAPQSLGTVSVEYKKFGTQIDFVPIVLGNGNIRLEVRPRVSEIDNTRSIVIRDIELPALRVREADTGAELRPGQTMAIAGLVQQRLEATSRGVPYLADLPLVGAAFRRMNDEVNEIELLILVTPELVEAMDPEQVPFGGPGLGTCQPDDCQFYWKGQVEVPCGVDGHRCGQCEQCCEGNWSDGQMSMPGAPNGVERLPASNEVLPLPSSNTADPRAAQRRPSAAPRLKAQAVRKEPPGQAWASDGAPRPATPQNANQASNRRIQSVQSRMATTEGRNSAPKSPGLIGPLGYDVER